MLHNNSLYPALRRFEEAGAVTKTAEPQQGRPPRLVYTLTEVGQELLHDMLADLPDEQAADPNEFMARLGQFSLINPAERAGVLASRTRAVRRQLAHFQTMRALATAAGLTGLLLGASQGASSGWTAPATWVPLAAGAALTAGYVVWAARREQPALDLSLALGHGQGRGPALSMGLCALASVVTWAAVFLPPVFVQSGAGPQRAGGGPGHGAAGLITGLSTALAPRWLTGLTVRITVLAGFGVLAVASLGLLLIAAATPLWLIAVILACRSVSVGLVINPLLQALVQPLRPDQLGDASTLFNTWQRIAGSFGIGLVAALYTTQARSVGPVAALHSAGLVLVAVAQAGALGALGLPPSATPPWPARHGRGHPSAPVGPTAPAPAVPAAPVKQHGWGIDAARAQCRSAICPWWGRRAGA